MIRIFLGDVMAGLARLPDETVQCCVTSPPYWGLRDYGVEGQIGLEPSLDEWLGRMVAVFAEVRRVLRPDGTLWLNCGDGYAGSSPKKHGWTNTLNGYRNTKVHDSEHITRTGSGLKAKDLLGMAWRLAFALQADGWFLRSDIVWHKPNPMPESVTDRPTRSHEYMFLMSKSARYRYDHEAVKEPGVLPEVSPEEYKAIKSVTSKSRWYIGSNAVPPSEWGGRKAGKEVSVCPPGGRNLRTVWTIPPQPFSEAHFAVFPEAFVERCLRASGGDGPVLDPFLGSGTTAVVAAKMGLDCYGCELNPEYVAMAKRRIGLLANVEVAQ